MIQWKATDLQNYRAVLHLEAELAWLHIKCNMLSFVKWDLKVDIKGSKNAMQVSKKKISAKNFF